MKLNSFSGITEFKPKILYLSNDKKTAAAEIKEISKDQKILPTGNLLSYGDQGLIRNGTYISLKNYNKFISLDRDNLLLEVESGMTLKEVIKVINPQGYDLPVTPGTLGITIGGAIANDVHGKNYHLKGSFAHHIYSLKLLRSNGEIIECSDLKHEKLFRATLGGSGLTGIILSAKIYLEPFFDKTLSTRKIPFKGYREYFELKNKNIKSTDHYSAWVDFNSKNIKGIIFLSKATREKSPQKNKLTKVRIFPNYLKIPLVNLGSVFLYNKLYFFIQLRKRYTVLPKHQVLHPLDNIKNWQNIYGKKGFYQFQATVPHEYEEKFLEGVHHIFRKYRLSSFLTVLKDFDRFKGKGKRGFPHKGFNLTVDFKKSAKSKIALEELYKLSRIFHGHIYLAKDEIINVKFAPYLKNEYAKNSKYFDPKISSLQHERILRSYQRDDNA